MQRHVQQNAIIACVCAGSTALAAHGIARGCTLTSHPSVADQFQGYQYSEDRVCIDGNIYTSRGPGCSFSIFCF